MTDSQRGVNDVAVLGQLQEMAKRAYAMNWSPYTGAVATAAVRTTSGNYYGGSNVEVANISLSKHAEESAVLIALAAEAQIAGSRLANHRFIDVVYVTAPPCGSCRQFLLEFATDDCLVHVDDGLGEPFSARLVELLPRPFGPDQQAAAQARTDT
jgi:cytidine deaminase